MARTIVVLGVAGVGKTTACQAFVRRHPEFEYISASNLLRETTRASVESIRTAEKSEILRNQLILVHALAARLTTSKSANFLIDAQNVIDNDRELVVVPVDSFRSLRPTGFILLEASPQELAGRRSAEMLRSRPNRALSELMSHTEETRNVAEDYAVRLNVPLVVGMATSGFELDPLIATLLKASRDGV